MIPPEQATVALTVAGSDSGGGAGIQADLAAFRFFHVFGTTAITAVTAQNPHHVTAVHPIDPPVVTAQIEAVFEACHVGAVKTGMLFSDALVHAVCAALRRQSPRVPLVVDPVMVATSGAPLLQEDAVNRLRTDLLPLATILTPNLPEAELLLDRRIRGRGQAIEAAQALYERTGAAVLLKGGHDEATNTAWDVLCCETGVRVLEGPRVPTCCTHGTGCSLSAALAACLALGDPLPAAVRKAKAYVLGHLRRCLRIGPDTLAMGPPADLPLDEVMEREPPRRQGTSAP